MRERAMWLPTLRMGYEKRSDVFVCCIQQGKNRELGSRDFPVKENTCDLIYRSRMMSKPR
jgi:hypothetical protein